MNESSDLDSLVTAITTQINALKSPIITIAISAVAILGLFLGIRYLVRASKTVK